eukprot:134088_1
MIYEKDFKIKYHGLRGPMLTLIDDLFHNTWTQTIVNGYGSDWLISMKGLDQGRILAQLLNLLFLDPLNNVIENNELIKLFSFVDDYLLYTTFPGIYTNVANYILQYEIDKLNEWLMKNKLQWKYKKSGIITFQSNIMNIRYPQHVTQIKLNIGNDKNPYIIESKQTTFKYLGSMLSYDLHPRITIQYIYKKK